MISKFDLSALGTESYKPIRPTHLRNEKESSDSKEKDDKELNRYVLSRTICELLNDYSEGPDFVKEDHNFKTLESLTEDDWTDVLKKIEKELKDKYDIDIKIDVEYDWIKKDGREIKAFIDKVWSLVEGGDDDTDTEEEPEDDDADDTKEEEEDTSDSEESYRGFLRNKKSDDKDDDEEDEAEAPSEDEEDEDEDDADKESSKGKKDKEEDDEDTDEEDDESDSDEEDEEDEDSDDEEDDEDSDDEDEDDELPSKSEEFLGGLFGKKTIADRIVAIEQKVQRSLDIIAFGESDTGEFYPLVADKRWVYCPEYDTWNLMLPSMKDTLNYLSNVEKTIAEWCLCFNHPDDLSTAIYKNHKNVSTRFNNHVELKTDGTIHDDYLESKKVNVKWPSSDWYNCGLRKRAPASVVSAYDIFVRVISHIKVLKTITKETSSESFKYAEGIVIWVNKVLSEFRSITSDLFDHTPVVDNDSPEADHLEQDAKSNVVRNIQAVAASKYPITPWNSDALYQDLRKLEVYHNYVRSLDVTSNEGIGTGLLKIFIGVTDTFLRIGNTFKTNIFKFYKDLKRSEMRYYYESHTTMCLKAESIPITQVTNVEVPVPSGMKGTYQNACMSLEQVYNILDIQSYGQGVLAALIDFRRKLMRSEDYKNTLVPMTNLVKQRETSLNSLKSSVDKVFTEQKTPMNVKFMDVYKTMKEFKDTRLALLDMEKYLAATNKLVKLVDDIDTVLADITSYLTEDQEIDKALVTDMINIVKYMGVSFDIYGTTTTRQMAVEHNHIGAIGKVWSTIN